MAQKLSIADLTHPSYSSSLLEWQKWRDIMTGGRIFIDRYLEQFSIRESTPNFEKRKKITYNPAFAKSAINEIKNAIFQRMTDIVRRGGSESYQRAVRGQEGGVDLLGSSMNAFLGRKVLPELLTMKKVGVFVDMPQLSGITLADTANKRPYLYMYRAEDIKTWRLDTSECQSEFSTLLLKDYVFLYDEDTGLPIGETERYRRLWVQDRRVHCQYYEEVMVGEGRDMKPEWMPSETVVLDIDRIPFVILELSESLLADVDNYQIALLNICSSDLNYILQSNYPFYTEQFEPRAGNPYSRPSGSGQEVNSAGEASGNKSGTGADALAAKSEELAVGPQRGRRYPKGMDRPGFIAPPSAPLIASMQKQEQMKAETRQLVHLSVANLQPRDASAESKGMDNQGLESGLSYIGMELEYGERRMATYWAMYEHRDVPTINYPEKYSLRTEEDRRNEADELKDLLETVPSETYRKEVCKRIVIVMLGNKVSNEQLDKIGKEIDAAVGITADVEILAKHVELGMLDLELAAKMCNYPAGTVAKAAEEHADRVARIAEAQGKNTDGGARGVNDIANNPASGSKEEKKQSRDTTQDAKVQDKTRGKAKP